MSGPAPELAAAMAETRKLREGLMAEIARLEDEARTVAPSKAAEIKYGVAARLRRLLDGE